VKRLKHELEYSRHPADIYDSIASSDRAALQSVLDIVKKVAKSNTTCSFRRDRHRQRAHRRPITTTRSANARTSSR